MILLLNQLKIIRPLNIILGSLSVGISVFLLDVQNLLVEILKPAFVVIFFIAGSNIINDIFDVSSDKVNHPKRPLTSKTMSNRTAWFLCVLSYCLGVFFALTLPVLAKFIALVVVFPISILYTPVLKRIPVIGNITIALMLAAVFLFTEASIIGRVEKLWIPSFLAFGLTWIRELMKDIADLEGDRENMVKTFPVKYGIKASRNLFVILTMFLSLFSITPFIFGSYGLPYFIMLVSGVILPMCHIIFQLFQDNLDLYLYKSFSKSLKVITVAGMCAIFFSKY